MLLTRRCCEALALGRAAEARGGGVAASVQAALGAARGGRWRGGGADVRGEDVPAEAAGAQESGRSRRRRLKREAERAADPYAAPPPPEEFERWEPRGWFGFEVVHESLKPGSRARVGRITTPHGVIDTPTFVAVGTNGTLKAVDHRQADATGLQLMFCNTYHLLLQPGPDTVAAAGGLHKYINRDRPIITDSGGFQVFSLAHGSVQDELNMKARGAGNKYKQAVSVLKVSEEGALFRSYRDGSKVMLTPESSVAAQKAFGADIIIPLDELPPYHIDRDALHRSVLLSHRWEARSLRTHLADKRQQAMYAVVHGGVDEDLRAMSADYLTQLPFDGFAIGGSLGKDSAELEALLRFVMPRVPSDKPNHLLGIADEPNIRMAVPYGVDSFDSCFPTRIGRHGTLMTRSGRLNIRRSANARAFVPPDPECSCFTCRHHTLAFLHHLDRAKEPSFVTLAAIHNVQYMTDMMAAIRQRILNDEI